MGLFKKNKNKDKNKIKNDSINDINGSNNENERLIINEDGTVQINENTQNSNNEIISLDDDKTFLGKFSKVLKEDDLDDFVWLIPEGDERKFMKTRTKNTIIFALVMFFVLTAIFLLDFFILKQNIPIPVYLIILAATTFIFFKKKYLNVKRDFNKKRDKVYNSFPLWVSTLQILILTNNVTNTFKKSIETCPEIFKHDLEIFVENIQYNPENKESYKNFLRKYKIDDVQEIIMDMYAFNRMDKDEIVHQFDIMNEKLNKIQSNIRKTRQKRNLFFIAALNSIPLLTASLYILAVSMMFGS